MMPMYLTDYYRFERVATKAKMRLDCTASTESYPEFEEKRATKQQRATEKRDATNAGDLVVYYGDVPDQFGGDVHRKADKSLTIKSKNLSSIFVPDPRGCFAYGDVRGTSDAILIVFDGFDAINGAVQAGSVMEIYIARGKSKDRVALFNLLCDGELVDEMSLLRERATQHHPAAGDPPSTAAAEG